MPKADVIDMAARRDLINPSGSIHFAFDDVMTEEELNRRVRLITDLIYSLGGHLNDDRGECVELEATDQSAGATWEGGGDESSYTRATGDRKIDRAMSLEDILEYMDCEQPPGYKHIDCTPKAGFQIVYRGEGYDEFPIWQLQVDLKRQRVLAVLSADNEIPLKKKDLQQPRAVVIYHQVRPLK